MTVPAYIMPLEGSPPGRADGNNNGISSDSTSYVVATPLSELHPLAFMLFQATSQGRCLKGERILSPMPLGHANYLEP